jgi:hypothetical protein
MESYYPYLDMMDDVMTPGVEGIFKEYDLKVKHLYDTLK